MGRLDLLLAGIESVPRSATRDRKRLAVYGAERAAFRDCTARYPSIAACQEYIDRCVEDRRFQAAFPHVKAIMVKASRSSRRMGSYWGGTIQVSKAGRVSWVLLHELAHGCADTWPSHGRDFVNAYLELVRLFMGAPARKALAAELRARKVPRRGTDLEAWKTRQRATCRRAARKGRAAAATFTVDPKNSP